MAARQQKILLTVIVAAMLDGEATVKVYRRQPRPRLFEPQPAHDVMYGDEAVILGKVVSVRRRL